MCGCEFDVFTELMDHQNTHAHSEFVCYVCKLVCPNPSALYKHIKIHKFGCSICPQEFTSKKLLDYHVGLNHGRPVNVLQCEICEFTCLDLAKFHTYFNQHHKTYRCTICLLGFHLQKELDEHVKEHTAEEPESDKVDMASVAPRRVLTPIPATPSISPGLPTSAEVPPPEASSMEQSDRGDMSSVSMPASERTTGGIDTSSGDTSGVNTSKGSLYRMGRNNMKCQVCAMYFATGQLKIEHINIYHRDYIVGCRFCRKYGFAINT